MFLSCLQRLCAAFAFFFSPASGSDRDTQRPRPTQRWWGLWGVEENRLSTMQCTVLHPQSHCFTMLLVIQNRNYSLCSLYGVMSWYSCKNVWNVGKIFVFGFRINCIILMSDEWSIINDMDEHNKPLLKHTNPIIVMLLWCGSCSALQLLFFMAVKG